MTTKIRLLIIEEHKAVRQALVTRLRSSRSIDVVGAFPRFSGGVSTNPANGSPAALNEHAPVPDVVLLSIKPGKERQFDETLSLVKRLVSMGTAVLIITPYADDLERELLLQAGASRYLLQNVNTPQLISEIEQVNAERAKTAGTVLTL